MSENQLVPRKSNKYKQNKRLHFPTNSSFNKNGIFQSLQSLQRWYQYREKEPSDQTLCVAHMQALVGICNKCCNPQSRACRASGGYSGRGCRGIVRLSMTTTFLATTSLFLQQEAGPGHLQTKQITERNFFWEKCFFFWSH